MTDPALATLRLQIRQMISDVLGAIGEPEETTELRRQVLSTFAFGMVFAAGMGQGLEPAQVHALVVGALEDSFGYNADQAVTFSEALIDAISGESRPTSNAIIHRGIEGYRQWSERELDELRANIAEIFAVLEDEARNGQATDGSSL
jgi:hypothetical protein